MFISHIISSLNMDSGEAIVPSPHPLKYAHGIEDIYARELASKVYVE
jgi:hypothetical protein